MTNHPAEANISIIPVLVTDGTDPVPSALVLLKNSNNKTRQVTVGVDGKGVLNNVPVGEWTATVSATGYDTHTETINITNDDELEFVLNET